MEHLKTTQLSLPLVIFVLFFKSSLQQGFTTFGLRGFGRPPLFRGFGPPPPGLPRLLPPPLGLPGFPGAGPPLPIVSPPLTTLTDGGTGSISLSGDTVPSTLDLSGFSSSVQTLPSGTGASIAGQSGFGGDLFTLSDPTSSLNTQNLITTLTSGDALLGGSTSSLTNSLATGMLTSDAGVPEGVDPASAAESSFVSRFSNGNINGGGSTTFTLPGRLNSFDSAPVSTSRSFDPTAILNSVFRSPGATPSTSTVTVVDNSPNQIIFTSGVSNNAAPSNLVQQQTMAAENTGERIPTINELQQMFTPTELSRNGGDPVIVSSSDPRSGGNRRGSETRITSLNSVTTVNRVDDPRSQVRSPSDELNMEFRNFIRADGGQTDPSDILYRFPPSSSSLNTASSISSERMSLPSNSILGETADPRTGSRTAITEIRSNTNIGSGPLNAQMPSSFAADPRLVLDPATSSISDTRGTGPVSQDGNRFDNRLINRPLSTVNSSENKSNVIINGNSNIVGSNVDMTRFVRNNEVQIPQSINLQRSDFENSASNTRRRVESPISPVNSFNERFDVRADPLNAWADPSNVRTDPRNVRGDPLNIRIDPLTVRADPLNVRTDPLNNATRTQQTIRTQDPGNDPQRGSKIVFVDGQNTKDDGGATRGVVFPDNQIAANTRVGTDAGNPDTQARVNINFNFPANQLEFNTNLPTVSSNSSSGVDPLTASQPVPDIRLFQRPGELWGRETGASDPGRSRMVDSRAGSLPTVSTLQRFETTNQLPRGNSNGDDPSIFQQTNPNRGNGGMTLQDATINMQPSSFQRFQSTDGITRANADMLDPNNFSTIGSNRARGGTFSQNDPSSIMQILPNTNQATGRNDEETDPRITGDVRDPNRSGNRMNSQTAQSELNVQNPEIRVNPQPSGVPTTRRFIKKTTTIRRFIVDPNENQTATSSQTATVQGSDPNAGLFARMNFGFSNINTSSNTNTGASTMNQEAINRFVPSSNMADTSGMPRIMGVQNSLQTSRFSQSVLPGNTVGTNSFVNAVDSTNDENRQPIMTRFVTASDPQSQGGRTRAGQVQNSIAMDPSFATNIDPSRNRETVNRIVTTSNMGDPSRTPQIMDVQNSLQTSRFSQSVLQGNTGDPTSFVNAVDSTNDENRQPLMTRFASDSDPQSQGGRTIAGQAPNSIAMDPSFATNMDPSRNQNTMNRLVSTSSMTDSSRTPQTMGVQNSPQTSRFSQSVLPGNTGNTGGLNSFVTTRGLNNDEDGQPTMTRSFTASDPQIQGSETGTGRAQNSISTNPAISPSSIETRFAPSNSGNLFRSPPSVEGSGFTNSGFPSSFGQNIGIGGFVSTNAGGSPGIQNTQSSIFERFGGTPAGSGFQTLRSTGDNFAVRSRQASNSSVVRNGAESRNGNSNDVTIIETSRRNVVLSSENSRDNNGGDRNGETVRGSTLPPIVAVNDTQSCLSTGCPSGEQCTFNQNFLCPEWVEASACQCRQGCQAYNRFIPLGTRLSVDTCGNVCVCNNNNGIADCTQRPCN